MTLYLWTFQKTKGKRKSYTFIVKFLVKSSFIDKMELKEFLLGTAANPANQANKMVRAPTKYRKIPSFNIIDT